MGEVYYTYVILILVVGETTELLLEKSNLNNLVSESLHC